MAKRRLMRITDEETGEVEQSFYFTGDFCFQYTDKENGEIHRAGMINNARFGDKHLIKSWQYRTIAARLVDKFEELAHIDVTRILFLQEVHWAPPKGGIKRGTWFARVKKAKDMLENTWGFNYVMEIRDWFTLSMTLEQIIALIYHELRHIGEEGDLVKHDIEDWNNMVATLGVNWATTRAEIMDLLGEEFGGFEELRTVGVQMSLYGRKPEMKEGA